MPGAPAQPRIFSVQLDPNPIHPGEYGEIAIHSNANQYCDASVYWAAWR